METIELVNDGTGLGFGIVGGKTTGVIVKTILPGGIADQVAALKHVCFLCVRGFGIVHRCLYSDYHEKKMIFFIFFVFYDTLRDYACQLGIMRTGSLQASTQLTVILSFVLSVTVGLSFTEAKRMVSTSGWTPAQWGPHPENRGN